MKRRDFVFSVLAPAAAGAFAVFGVGCGGSSGGGSSNSGRGASTGRFSLTFKWPTRAVTRLIPVLTQSIVATLKASDGTVLGTRTITANDGPPQVSTVTFDNLAPGQVTLFATAYPNNDGTGVAMATGSVGAAIKSAQTTSVTLTMGSTIDHIDVTPTSPSVAIAATVALTATPRDAAGNVVLVPDSNLKWVSGATGTATASSGAGATIQAAGVAVGSATFTVTESDSGKKGTTTVTVTTADTGACVPGPITGNGGLANAPWPMFGHDLARTFRGGAGGATGVLKWTASTGGMDSIGSAGTVIAADGTVYISNNQSRNAAALNPANGSVLRTFDQLGPNPTLGANGFIYASNSSGLEAVDLQSGAQKWNFSAQSGGSVAIGADGTVYTSAFVKNSSGTLVNSIVALNGTTGVQKWLVSSTNGVGSPSVGADGTVYAVSEASGINAIEPSCGTLKWTFLPPTGFFFTTTPSIGSDGTLYARANSSSENRLYAISATGTEKWHVVVTQGTTSPSIGADGTLYMTSNSAVLTAYDPNSGAVKFTFTAPGSNPSSFGNPGIASDNTVYFNSRSISNSESGESATSLLHAIDGATGTEKWAFQVPGQFTSAEFVGPVIGPDGTVYIADDDHATVIAVM